MLRALIMMLGMTAATVVQAADPPSLWPQRARAAANIDAWQQIKALRSRGTLAVGGLEGSFEMLEDASSGHSRSKYQLGPLEGAQGFDGETSWSRTGTETIVADGPEARQRAITAAWLTRRGYLSDVDVHYERLQQSEADATHMIVAATPAGGSRIELWFDADTALLTRSVQQAGQDRQVTHYADYRTIAGVPVPHRVISEGNDPRNRAVIQIQHVEAVRDLPPDAFARPAVAAQDFSFNDGTVATVLRFDLLNNHIFVDARIDGHEVRLLFDTGGLNLLTPQAAQRLGLSTEGRMAARGVGENQVDVSLARAGRLELGALQLDAPLFYVMDLGDLPAVEGFEFDGLVGYEILHRVGVQIDYAGRRLALTHPDHYQPPQGVEPLQFTLDERIPVVDGEVAGIPARLSIDTGSRASISLHTPFVREHDLVERLGACYETVVGWGVGGAARGAPARLRSVRLGGIEVTHVLASLSTRDNGAFANPDISANVGSGLLRRFVVDFDYRARNLYLVPGPDHGYVETDDRAGMWLMLDGDVLKVAAVTPAGAAAKAGVEAGDLILAVDDAAVASRSLVEWRELLRTSAPGTRVSLQLLRGERKLTSGLTLSDRLSDCEQQKKEKGDGGNFRTETALMIREDRPLAQANSDQPR